MAREDVRKIFRGDWVLHLGRPVLLLIAGSNVGNGRLFVEYSSALQKLRSHRVQVVMASPAPRAWR
jgi:soluble P-type ATPase